MMVRDGSEGGDGGGQKQQWGVVGFAPWGTPAANNLDHNGASTNGDAMCNGWMEMVEEKR